MANLGTVLKSEITRLARKEIRAHLEPLKKANGIYRRDIADLKRQVALLERQAKLARKSRSDVPSATEAKTGTRFVAKGLRSLRSRLGLSATDFGKLVGASGQSVYNWEHGKSVPGQSKRTVLSEFRSVGKLEAQKRLESLELSSQRAGKRRKASA